MNSTPDLERVFPLSGGMAPRPRLRPPRLPAAPAQPHSVPLSNGALLRAWAARRAQAAFAAGSANIATPG